MSLLAVLDALEAAGVDSATILAAVRAHEARRIAEDEERKAKAAAKKRRQRKQHAEDVPECPGDIGGQEGTIGDNQGQAGTVGDSEGQTLSRPLSPQTPLSPTHTRERNKTTRARALRRCPEGWEPTPKTYAKLAEEGFAVGDLERALTRMRDHEFAKPHSDWDAVFRNWVRNDADRRPQPRIANDRPHHEQRQSAREDSLRNMHAGAMAALNRRLG